jgi:hypothetical protein
VQYNGGSTKLRGFRALFLSHHTVCTIKLPAAKHTAGLHTQSIKIASNNELIIVVACDFVPIILMLVILYMRKSDMVLLSFPVSQ